MNTQNPFVLNANIASYWSKPEAKKGNGYTSDGVHVVTGIVKPQPEVVYRDVSAFMKFFKGSFSVIKKLNSPSLCIIEYITDNIKSGHDWVHLPVNDVILKCGYKTRRAYYTGIKQLIEMELISVKDKKHNFWINPNIFFKGDRRKIKNEP